MQLPKLRKKVMLKINFEEAVANVKEFIRIRDEHFAKKKKKNRLLLPCNVSTYIYAKQYARVGRHREIKLKLELIEWKDTSFGRILMKSNIYQWKQHRKHFAMEWVCKQANETKEKFRKTKWRKSDFGKHYSIKKKEDKEIPESYECPF